MRTNSSQIESNVRNEKKAIKTESTLLDRERGCDGLSPGSIRLAAEALHRPVQSPSSTNDNSLESGVPFSMDQGYPGGRH